jgi:hypothetical protein
MVFFDIISVCESPLETACLHVDAFRNVMIVFSACVTGTRKRLERIPTKSLRDVQEQETTRRTCKADAAASGWLQQNFAPSQQTKRYHRLPSSKL